MITPENKIKRQLKNANENIEKYQQAFKDDNYSYDFEHRTPYQLILTCNTHQTSKKVSCYDYNDKNSRCELCKKETSILDGKHHFDEQVKLYKIIYPNKNYQYQQLEDNRWVKLKCLDHDIEYNILRSDHKLKKSGCKKCGLDIVKNCRVKSFEYYLPMYIKTHGNFYDYSKYVYSTTGEVIIICPIHGEFKQLPQTHIRHGCRECGNQKHSKIKIFSTEELIEKANEIHGNKYDYSKSIFIERTEKIKIICLKHGEFEQRITDHLNGHGCFLCSNRTSKPEARWLNEVAANSLRNHSIKIPGRKRMIKADGYDSKTNTIYEFHGDYWHGNPNVYNSNDYNKIAKATFGELYQRTIVRENQIKAAGYNLVVIWEKEWKEIEKNRQIESDKINGIVRRTRAPNKKKKL